MIIVHQFTKTSFTQSVFVVVCLECVKLRVKVDWTRLEPDFRSEMASRLGTKCPELDLTLSRYRHITPFYLLLRMLMCGKGFIFWKIEIGKIKQGFFLIFLFSFNLTFNGSIFFLCNRPPPGLIKDCFLVAPYVNVTVFKKAYNFGMVYSYRKLYDLFQFILLNIV